jgi:cytochrome c553
MALPPRANAAWVAPLLAVAALVFGLAEPLAAQPEAERLAPCLACHGANGQSQTADVPSLGGQPVFYLTVQLLMFREGMRVAAPMNELLKGASDDDLRAFAEALAKLPPPQPNPQPLDAATVETAQALVQRNRCNICHRPNFSGDENVPRLAGQREEYLLKALRAYKDNSRPGYDSQMADVVEPLSDADFVALAAFLARAK